MNEKDYWDIGVGLFQGVCVIGGVGLSYLYAIRQMKRQVQLQIEQDETRRRADALHSAWQLLSYLSKTENANSLFHWERVRIDGQLQEVYYLNRINAQRFIEHALPEVFYDQQVGLYWYSELKDLLFNCRNTIYSILEKKRHEPGGLDVLPERIVLGDQGIAQKIYDLYNELNHQLRQDIKQVYQK